MKRRVRIGMLVAGVLLVLLGVATLVGSALAERLGERRFPPAVGNGRGAEHRGAGGGGPNFVTDRVRIAFLGDVQRGIGDVARPLVEALRREQVLAVVQHGDLVSHGEAPYYGIAAKAFDLAGLDSHPPMAVVPGNHDVEPDGRREWTEGRRLFEERIGNRWWRMTVTGVEPGLGVLLVGLDDSVEPVSQEQLDWLDGVLRSETRLPWLLAIHKPPRLLDEPGTPPMDGMDDLVRRLEARPPIAVVSGHYHEDADVTVNGVRYVVNASGGDLDGGPLRAPRPASLLLLDAVSDGRAVFRRVPLERRSWLAIDLDRLWVRLWSDRRRAPWAPWALLPAGAALVVVSRRRPS